MNHISHFNKHFIGFFERYTHVYMEIRTKSANIQSLLNLDYVPKNTEIAFSLNPQILIERYERGTASLDERIGAIQQLTMRGFRVGIRLLPLLPIQGYKEIYTEFFTYLTTHLPLDQIHSNFASGLLYTKDDYTKILKKYPQLDILHYLHLEDDGFYREAREVRDWFYIHTKAFDPKCILCLENIE